MTFENKLRALVRFAQRRDLTTREMLEYLKELLLEYNKIKKRMDYESWQGKSTFEIERFPDKVIVTKYQKKKGCEPRPNYTEIAVIDLNLLSYLINKFCVDKIKSKELAELFCKYRKIKKTPKGKHIFYDDNFIWDNFFSWRKMHNKFTIMLNVLSKDGHIKYSGGIVSVVR